MHGISVTPGQKRLTITVVMLHLTFGALVVLDRFVGSLGALLIVVGALALFWLRD